MFKFSLTEMLVWLKLLSMPLVNDRDDVLQIDVMGNLYTSILPLTILSTVYYAFMAILGGTASIVKMAAKDAAGAEVVVCISCTYVLYLIIFNFCSQILVLILIIPICKLAKKKSSKML